MRNRPPVWKPRGSFTRLRHGSSRILNKDLFHSATLIVAGAFCVYWYVRVPEAGKALLVLGAVAAIMMLVEMRPLHKALYIALILALVAAENRALNKERMDTASQSAAQLRHENERFDAVLKENQRHFDTTLEAMQAEATLTSKTMTLSHEALQQITGAGAYCYVMPTARTRSKDGQLLYLLSVMNPSTYPLDVCHINIEKLVPINKDLAIDPQLQQAEYYFYHRLADEQFGPLPPRQKRSAASGFWTNIALAPGSYSVSINTRNDSFSESLYISPKGYNNTLQVRNASGKVIYSDPAIPKADRAK